MNEPLTDEELAEIGRGHERMDAPFGGPGFCRRCSHLWPCPTSRLVADLHVARSEATRLLAVIDHLASDVALVESQAEVERLRAEVDGLREELTEAVKYGEECLARMGGTW